MLEKKLRGQNRNYIAFFIGVQTLILVVYASIATLITFHVFVLLGYIVIVMVSTVLFTMFFVKHQTHYCGKKFNVSHTCNDTHKRHTKDDDVRLLPHFMFVKNTNETTLKDFINDTHKGQEVVMLFYDVTYACVKDVNGREFLTYTNNLEFK